VTTSAPKSIRPNTMSTNAMKRNTAMCVTPP
jgi:hypothetical protein